MEVEIQHAASGNNKCFSVKNESAGGTLPFSFFGQYFKGFCRQDIHIGHWQVNKLFVLVSCL